MFGMFETGIEDITLGQIIMLCIASVLLYLAIVKNIEPFLLGPMGFAAILANLPLTGSTDPGGFMYIIYHYLIKTSIIPLFIFLGIGTMMDFSPLLANPITFLLGAVAQFGIFIALGVSVMIGFSLDQSATIGIIGGADGPTTIYIASKLAPEILGPVTVAAYSYMALVPLIQPPLIKLMTTKEQRCIQMKKLREVSNTEKVIFPIAVTIIVGMIVPSAVPLIGMLMIGNLFRVSGVMDRLSKTGGNEIMNIATILLGIGVGFMMTASLFINIDTFKILLLGLFAFIAAIACGLIFGQVMWKLSGGKINPMIGSAGVSAMPMAARVVAKQAAKDRPGNIMIMHAMGPNVAGQIGSACAAGIILGLLA
ncbi:MAG: sodium ion-translocating decarboxylase subunit beta [Thermoplasmata archaeon]|nr:sodium ion-translocating decarboxylase subunit beta [Thermoplasmata archaeon]